MTGTAKVLVVDDEQVVLDGVSRHLKRDGYEVVTALSAAEALEAIEEDEVSVLVSDLMMPGMDGLELLDRIRETVPGLPVIMITGYATMKTALQALRKGAFDYIAKPFTRAELLGVVARAARQAAISLTDMTAPTIRMAPAGCVEFGNCWVKRLDDGSVRIGIDSNFASTVGEADQIDLPASGDFLEQGSACLKFLSDDGRTHALWTPVSGSVVEVNEKALSAPDLLLSDPYGEGWLIRIEAQNLEEELKGLDVAE